MALALLGASSALLAQTPRVDCTRAKDPARCEQRVTQAKAAHEAARKACEGKAGGEERECMRREMCAQTRDPAKCEAHLKERSASRSKIRQECRDLKGEELRRCIREQRQKK